MLEISVVLSGIPLHACPLTLFPRHLLAGIRLYQFLFRNRMVSWPSKTKELLLGKGGGDKGNKSLEKRSDYWGQQMWSKEGVLGSKYQRWKNKEVEGMLFRPPSKALEGAWKYLRTWWILPRGSYQGQVVELNGPCGFTWCCHSYILLWFKFLNIWLLAKFA